ncbi:hypothetical protein V3C99_000840 [Haemonchus contortus]
METSQDERLKEIIKKKKKVAAGLAIKHRWLKSKRLMSVKQIKSLCNKKKSKKIDSHHASSVPHEPTEKPILKKEVKKSEPRVIPLEPVQEGQKSVRPLSMKPKSSQQLQKPASSRPLEMRPVPPPLPKIVPKKEVPKASDITAPKKESSVLTKPSNNLTKKPKDFRELFASIPFEPPRRVVPPPYPCWVDGRFQSGCVERVELKPLAKSPPPRDEPSGRASPSWERYYPEGDSTNWVNGSFDEAMNGQQCLHVPKTEPVDELLDHTYHRLMPDSRNYHQFDVRQQDYYDYDPYLQNYQYERSTALEYARGLRYVPSQQQYAPVLYVDSAHYPANGAAGPSYAYGPYYSYEADYPATSTNFNETARPYRPHPLLREM